MIMIKTLAAMTILGASFAGSAYAACTLPAGNVPYDYFNHSTNPRTILSGITCETAQNYRAQDEAEFGDPGTINRLSNQNWSWFGCNSGSGLDLAFAAIQLRNWGCPSGTLCNGENGNCIPY